MISLVRSVYSARAFLLSLTLILICLGPRAQAAPAPTATTLTLSSLSASHGTAVTLTATVTSFGVPIMPGLVYFCNAAAAYCEDINVLGTAQLTVNGTASIKLILAIGDHVIRAVFHGTNSFASSQSAVQTLSVTGLYPTATTTKIEASGDPADYTLTATVTAYSKTSATGTVSFVNQTDGDQLIGSAQLGIGSTSNPFLALTPVSVDYIPSAVAVGDFNDDGRPDVAVACSDGTVIVLLGKGDGTFIQGQVFSLTPSSWNGILGVVTGDFNNDGRLDLAVSPDVYDNVSILTILLGNGDGTFTAVRGPSLTSHGGSFAIGDFNGDGNADLVLGGYGNEAGTRQTDVLLGKGDGTFAAAPPITGFFAGPMVAADFDGDGKLDLAVVRVYVGGLTVLPGKGDGTFGAGPDVATASSYYAPALIVADLNGDGKPDLVSGGGGQQILLNNGNGGFNLTYYFLWNSYFLAAGDLNGDGIVDLVYTITPDTYSGTSGVDVVLGNGDGSFHGYWGTPLNYTPYTLAIADFDGDGLSDVLVGSSHSIQALVDPWTTAASAVLDHVTFHGTAARAVYATYPGDEKNASSSSGTITLYNAPKLSVTPASLNFGIVPPGQTSDPQTLTLQNTGDASLTISNVFMSIPGSGTTNSFAVRSSSCYITLIAGASCTVWISLGPGVKGVQSANFAIASNDPANPTLNVPLTGVTQSPATITAASMTINWGAPVPTITATATGLTGGDTIAILAPVCATTYTVTSNAGTYPTTCSGATNPGNKYVFVYVAGKLTVNPPPATMISPVPGSTFTSTSVMFTWTPSGAANQIYALNVSAVAPGGSEIYRSPYIYSTFVTDSNLPMVGKTLYVRLFTYLAGAWQYSDYTYTSPVPVKAALTAPVSGPITSSPVTFTWNPGSGVRLYALNISAIAPGGRDVYQSPYLYTTSVTVSVRSPGKTLYVRLFSLINNAWQYNDYVF